MRTVRFGTPQFHGTSLCANCRNLATMQGTSMNQGRQVCEVFGPITHVVTSCNKHDDASRPPVYELENTAWQRIRDKKGNYRWVDRQEYLRLARAEEIF